MDAVVIGQLRKNKSIHSSFLLRLDVLPEELEVISAQPATQVLVCRHKRASIGKDLIAAGVIKMIMRVDHETDGKARNFTNLDQKLLGRNDIDKRIYNRDAIVAYNE